MSKFTDVRQSERDVEMDLCGRLPWNTLFVVIGRETGEEGRRTIVAEIVDTCYESDVSLTSRALSITEPGLGVAGGGRERTSSMRA